jgi:hypothetical protein
MTYQEKNITVTLSSAILILGYYLLRIYQIAQNGALDSASVFRLWGVVIVATIVVNIVGMILAHTLFAVAQAIQTRGEPEIENIEDERDKLIKLKGTRIAYFVLSIGVFLSMLTLVFGQPALVMFSLLIFFSIFSEIVADISRLIYSRRGM